ncbi:MAG: AraC family transcriptional regulator, partial [Planctomycetota bacterium]
MLSKNRTPSLRDRAAEPTLERIVRDQRRASAQVVPILEYILEHLFDYELQVEKLKHDLGIRDASVLSRFSQNLGESIWEYVTERRLEVAARLLRDTDLKVFQIGTSLGYASGDSFSQAFKRRREVSPAVYRKACAEQAANAGRQSELVSGVEIERGMAGELDPGQATRVIRRLDEIRQRFVEVYPHLGAARLPVPAPPPLLGAELVEATMAEAVWRRVEGLPVGEAEAVVRGQVAMSTPALFELLERKVYEIRDRRRAVEIARLAPPSVDA